MDIPAALKIGFSSKITEVCSNLITSCKETFLNVTVRIKDSSDDGIEKTAYLTVAQTKYRKNRMLRYVVLRALDI